VTTDLEAPAGRPKRSERWTQGRTADEQAPEEVRDIDTERSEGLGRNRTGELDEKDEE
jgi:hypothetical protein